MGNVWTLFKREYAAYFNGPVAYIVVPIFLLIFGIFFWFVPDFFTVNQASLRRFFSMAPMVASVFAPAITMRLIAEERRSGTLELLATLPYRDEDIILGKFLAAFGLLATSTLLTLPYAFTVAALGTLDWGPVIGGYVGMLLMGGAYLALGTFASSVTSNQIVAFFLALFASVLLLLVDYAAYVVVPPAWSGFVEFFSFNVHFQNIARGVIDSRDVLFYLSVMGLNLALAVHVLRRRRLN